MTHPDNLTGADVFDVPDESLSPTDPSELVPWLRALPVGTILRDERGEAWKLTEFPALPPSHPVPPPILAFTCTDDDDIYRFDNDGAMGIVAEHGPFRVLWASGGGARQRKPGP